MGGTSKLAGAVIAVLVVPLIGALWMIVVVLDTGAAACALPSTAQQPGASREAETSVPGNFLRLYQVTGSKYRIPWVELAAIGKLETDHGRDPSPGVRSGANFAGAAGPMQIGIGGAAGDSWSRYKTDGNGDGVMSVYDPADAVPAAARILIEDKRYRQDGARTAIRRYNGSGPQAEDYADKAMMWARRYSSGGFSVSGPTNAGVATTTCTTPNVGALVQKVIAFALAQRGKPYVWGATGPDAWDCSSLVQAAYASVGITIPRTTFEQWPFGEKVPKGTEQPGDLVFFNSGPGTGDDRPGHVGMVVDPAAGTMIVARCSTCSPAIGVQNYKTRADWIGSTRPLARPDIQAKLTARTGAQPAAGAKSPLTGNQITPTMRTVLNEIDSRFGPFLSIGCYRSTGDPQDHGRGRACDFMEASGNMPTPARRAHGDQVAAYAVTNARRLGISYIIWRQHIWHSGRGGQGWRLMPDRGGITANHQDHVHISVRS